MSGQVISLQSQTASLDRQLALSKNELFDTKASSQVEVNYLMDQLNKETEVTSGLRQQLLDQEAESALQQKKLNQVCGINLLRLLSLLLE